MNTKIRELADKAGFCFWANESWKPEGAIIDWGCSYDNEFQEYTEILINECLKALETGDIDYAEWKLKRLLEPDNDQE